MVGRGIARLFYDRGRRRGWVVSSTPRPHFTAGKDPVPILQEAGWAPGSVWTGGKSRPHQDSISDPPARSQSLYWATRLTTRWCTERKQRRNPKHAGSEMKNKDGITNNASQRNDRLSKIEIVWWWFENWRGVEGDNKMAGKLKQGGGGPKEDPDRLGEEGIQKDEFYRKE